MIVSSFSNSNRCFLTIFVVFGICQLLGTTTFGQGSEDGEIQGDGTLLYRSADGEDGADGTEESPNGENGTNGASLNPTPLVDSFQGIALDVIGVIRVIAGKGGLGGRAFGGGEPGVGGDGGSAGHLATGNDTRGFRLEVNAGDAGIRLGGGTPAGRGGNAAAEVSGNAENRTSDNPEGNTEVSASAIAGNNGFGFSDGEIFEGSLGNAIASARAFNRAIAEASGTGGKGSSVTGSGGQGGDGGSGSAIADAQTLTAEGEAIAMADATGGEGGDILVGSFGTGGNGGQADATTTIEGNRGLMSAVANGGDGGIGRGLGESGGKGGSGTINFSSNQRDDSQTDDSISIDGKIRAGDGGDGFDEANGGNGGDARLINPLTSSSSTQAGNLNIRLDAEAGRGGQGSSEVDSLVSSGGQGGIGISELTLERNVLSDGDETRAEVRAVGGDGGKGSASGGNGGLANSQSKISSTGNVTSNTFAFGGDGSSGAFSAGNGGNADSASEAVGTGSNNQRVNADSRAFGGDGGSIDSGQVGTGGSGGNASATARIMNNNSTNSGSVVGFSEGGEGGTGRGSGESGGSGGSGEFQLSAAHANPNGFADTLFLDGFAQGGQGGRGLDGANGGEGGAARVLDGITNGNEINGGRLSLEHETLGGEGGRGFSGNSNGGKGGDANSQLEFTRQDVAGDSFETNAVVKATGGLGGEGGMTGGQGGNAIAGGTITALENVNATFEAHGGDGGRGNASNPFDSGGGNGGNAQVRQANVSNAAINHELNVVANGGQGGNGGVAKGGNGGAALIDINQAINDSESFEVDMRAVGGTGGSGGIAGKGGDGELLANLQLNLSTPEETNNINRDILLESRGGIGGRAAIGETGGNAGTSVTLESLEAASVDLRIDSRGGSGGNEVFEEGLSGRGGSGGAGESSLNFLLQSNGGEVAQPERIQVNSTGGNGGDGLNTGGLGGDAASELTFQANEAISVDGISVNAVGGAGGVGSQSPETNGFGGTGGNANAIVDIDASFETQDAIPTFEFSALAQGGSGGASDTLAGTGGNGTSTLVGGNVDRVIELNGVLSSKGGDGGTTLATQNAGEVGGDGGNGETVIENGNWGGANLGLRVESIGGNGGGTQGSGAGGKGGEGRIRVGTDTTNSLQTTGTLNLDVVTVGGEGGGQGGTGPVGLSGDGGRASSHMELDVQNESRINLTNRGGKGGDTFDGLAAGNGRSVESFQPDLGDEEADLFLKVNAKSLGETGSINARVTGIGGNGGDVSSLENATTAGSGGDVLLQNVVLVDTGDLASDAGRANVNVAQSAVGGRGGNNTIGTDENGESGAGGEANSTLDNDLAIGERADVVFSTTATGGAGGGLGNIDTPAVSQTGFQAGRGGDASSQTVLDNSGLQGTATNSSNVTANAISQAGSGGKGSGGSLSGDGGDASSVAEAITSNGNGSDVVRGLVSAFADANGGNGGFNEVQDFGRTVSTGTGGTGQANAESRAEQSAVNAVAEASGGDGGRITSNTPADFAAVNSGSGGSAEALSIASSRFAATASATADGGSAGRGVDGAIESAASGNGGFARSTAISESQLDANSFSTAIGGNGETGSNATTFGGNAFATGTARGFNNDQMAGEASVFSEAIGGRSNGVDLGDAVAVANVNFAEAGRANASAQSDASLLTDNTRASNLVANISSVVDATFFDSVDSELSVASATTFDPSFERGQPSLDNADVSLITQIDTQAVDANTLLFGQSAVKIDTAQQDLSATSLILSTELDLDTQFAVAELDDLELSLGIFGNESSGITSGEFQVLREGDLLIDEAFDSQSDFETLLSAGSQFDLGNFDPSSESDSFDETPSFLDFDFLFRFDGIENGGFLNLQFGVGVIALNGGIVDAFNPAGLPDRSTSVPEPGLTTLLVMGGVMTLFRRRKRKATAERKARAVQSLG